MASKPQEFIGSFAFDTRLAPYDIMGSMAHASMLGRKKIIPPEAAESIIKGLGAIQKDLSKGWQLPYDEDIHFAMERELIRRVGKAGKMLHTGRSRNDQVVTDLYLYLKDHIKLIVKEISRLQGSIVKLASKYNHAVMPGFTHLQHAQPVLFAHHILAYAWMLERDKGRFRDALKRLDVLPLGSAALAGTSFPIDRSMTARLLKFKEISENSIDATSSRDGVAEFLGASAILMSNLSRFCEEIILWSSEEFSFIEVSTEFTSGSSIMPQKRNPDVAEIVRGETGRVYGALVAMLTVLKGLPLAYNRDLQEDKPPLFDAVDTLMGSLSVMAPMVASIKINGAQMQLGCQEGFLEATELADYLTKRGVPFRAAHGVVHQIVLYCQKKKIKFKDLSLPVLKRFHAKFEPGVFDVLTPEHVVRAKSSYGGTSPASVKRQIKKLKSLLKSSVRVV
jgi:argininosuccinate lyase